MSNGIDFLDRILEQKRTEVEASKRLLPEERLREMAKASSGRQRRFLQRLAAPGVRGVNIIAEVKRASPSRGPIRPDLDLQHYAKAYEEGGAAAISVLTEKAHFKGDPEDLRRLRDMTELPLLRKDFVVSSYQIYEAACWKADAVLLIVRALSAEQLQDFLALCHELNLDALVEVHSEEELEQASIAGARLVGINNRDLRSFKTDIQTSVRLAKQMSDGQVPVAESGIHNRSDIEILLAAGMWNFLIGESVVRAPDPVKFLKELQGMPEG